MALTSLGAGLIVGAAAPIASATTVADEAPLAPTTAFPLAAPLASLPSATGLADAALTGTESALSGANWSRLGHFKLYPLAGTGIDPLSNMVSTNLGGIPVSIQPITQMVEDGLPVTDLPVVGALFAAPHD